MMHIRKKYYRPIVYGCLSLCGLLLSACDAGKINTAVDLPEDLRLEEDTPLKDGVVGYFERESYAKEETDEMFYVIENALNQSIEVSEAYFVEKLSDNEWLPVDHHIFNPIESVVRILPEASAEFVFWLALDASDFDQGTYRLVTRLAVLEDAEESQNQEANVLYIPFEINE